MADYHIYLHNSAGETPNPTKPKETQEGGKNKKTSPTVNFINQATNLIVNPDSLISSAKTKIGGTLKSAAKIAVPLAIAGALIKIGDKVITEYLSFSETASGNYTGSFAYGNFKQSVHNFFHPFSTWLGHEKAKLQIKVGNLRNEQERLLLGGTIYNSNYGRYL